MRIEPTIFELSSPGRTGTDLPPVDVPVHMAAEYIDEENLRDELNMPEMSQLDIIRHYTHLSSENYSVDDGLYPLGSCTMKYNPRICQELSAISGLTDLHPYQDENSCQGILEIMYTMQCMLAEIGGMDAVTLQPAAGAQGEITALMIFKRHHERVGEGHRNIVIVPDSSHGTNPATAARCGYNIMKVPSGPDGLVDISALGSELTENVAAVMLTNPNTLGLFESRIETISKMVHDVGALLYCDGANMNAILGVHRPGDAGFDAMHFNLHKTFSAPHGGGGPGSGPVGVKSFLAQYLPVPSVTCDDGKYSLDYDRECSIGRVHSFYGNIAIIVWAYAYILNIGPEGLSQVSENAVLNANYLLKKISSSYDVPYGARCMHEFVASALKFKTLNGVRAIDIAKRLMDYGYYPPTIYFPLIVPEALMIEPTETESIETLSEFARVMIEIADDAATDPEVLKSAPHTTRLTRVDETAAARRMELRWKDGD